MAFKNPRHHIKSYFWHLVHNLVAHPMLVLPVRFIFPNTFHDYTANKAYVDSMDTSPTWVGPVYCQCEEPNPELGYCLDCGSYSRTSRCKDGCSTDLTTCPKCGWCTVRNELSVTISC